MRALSKPGGLIVSVQAPEGSPLRDPEVIAAMAEASLRNGATGVRLESPVYITPGWREISEVWAAGADVIALDATERLRPGGAQLAALINRAKAELGAPLMADIDSLSNGLRAAELGCDWVGTTLFGYTEATAASKPPAWDLVPQLRAQLPTEVSLICEGGIASAEQARRALDLGADAVVVGTAITGVDLQVAAYTKALG